MPAHTEPSAYDAADFTSSDDTANDFRRTSFRFEMLLRSLRNVQYD